VAPLGEVFIKINGETHYLWRAVDHEGEALDSFVTKRRDRMARIKFPREIMKRHGRAHVFVTDKLRSYGAAMKVIGKKSAAGKTIEPRIHTSHSDEESGPCFP
jgi:putative transposase